MRNRLDWLAVITMLFASSSTVLQAGPISEIIAFGDSLNDTGNVYAGSVGTTPLSPPYYEGQFSNGPIWLVQLANALGLTPPQPFLAVPGGTNYSVGGATSSLDFTPPGIPNLLTQVAGYALGVGGVADPNALYVIWAGGNDYLNGETNPLIPSFNVSLAVATLAGMGATNFMVMNLAPLGDIPQSITDLSVAERAQLNLLVEQNNLLLKTNLDFLASAFHLSIAQPDIYSLFKDIQANPDEFGFTNITEGALLAGDLGAAGYLFWDGLHPTTAGYEFVTGTALASIPEPSSAVLCGLAGVCIAGWRLRQRRSQIAV